MEDQVAGGPCRTTLEHGHGVHGDDGVGRCLVIVLDRQHRGGVAEGGVAGFGSERPTATVSSGSSVLSPTTGTALHGVVVLPAATVAVPLLTV